jgi:hypothetical protein
MLPGFSKDELFMAIEGFASGSHNRSDEAFTVADLEEFKMDNFIDAKKKTKQTLDEEDMDEGKVGAGEVTELDMIDDEEQSGATTTTKGTMPTKKTTTTTTTKGTMPTKKTTTTTTTKGTMPTKKTTTTKYSKTDKKYMNSNKSADNSPFKNLEPYEDEMDVNEEDPENPEDDRGMGTELVDGELEAEDPPAEPEDIAAEEAAVEGFTGSATANEYYLKTFLKALLITFICFVLCHPYTGKVFTKFVRGIHKDILVFILLFVLIYIVLAAF